VSILKPKKLNGSMFAIPFDPPVRSTWPKKGKLIRLALLTKTTNAWPKKSVKIAR